MGAVLRGLFGGHILRMKRPAVSRPPLLSAAVAASALCLSGCASSPPKEISAGRLGTIATAPPQHGSYQEGASLEWLKFVVTASLNGYPTPDPVPAGYVLSKSKVRSSL